MDISLSQIKPIYPPKRPTPEAPQTQSIISALNLDLHPEGGYFRETDRHPHQVLNPFVRSTSDRDIETRSASSSILYFLTPQRPLGVFHRNQGRTVHVWQRGRGRYVIIHADEVESESHGQGHCPRAKARVETFIVGPDVGSGERLQWVVGGGKYKSSFLLPDEPEGEASSGLLITEVVVPGFDLADHEFLRKDEMKDLLTADQVEELSWMLKEYPDQEKE
ncbi:hypothetical protein N7457_004752 [Penicillium paradoxum]|uniref:uncharacterized protein n=1 Tax=Penicillium paradoxum TaxID=176176 RepID=UPI0025496361|nr:uncharacterized protein N7457_004752 [Penicillium paradoxum]KAJ5782978.1 hypothetical protein N7457_004752 [Penicillium paradoxum]